MEDGCPGCGGGEGHQPCAVIRCSQQHSGVEYCFLCEEYPCQRLQDSLEFDSFLTHQHMLRDLDRAQKMGMETYLEELGEKTAILEKLLAGYNDGRRKSFFCLAVNLLERRDFLVNAGRRRRG